MILIVHYHGNVNLLNIIHKHYHSKNLMIHLKVYLEYVKVRNI